MKTKRILTFLLFIMLLKMGWVWADDAAKKFSRGLGNAALGWFEIVNEIGNESDRHGPFIGFPSGLIRGTAFGITRTVIGAFEVVTFLFPNGEKGYGPIILPEFVFDHR